LDKNRSWLAQKIGVSRQAVNLYTYGVSIPRGDNLNKLLVALEIKDRPKSLDDFFE